ncbi:MAG: hypothetical protein ACRYHA_29625 [Janthinobacterium lividum]
MISNLYTPSPCAAGHPPHSLPPAPQRSGPPQPREPARHPTHPVDRYCVRVEDCREIDQAMAHSKMLRPDYLVARPRPEWLQARNAFIELQRRLYRDASDFLRTPSASAAIAPARMQTLPQLPPDATPETIIAAALRERDGIVIGESHDALGSKRFVIDHLGALRANGVRALFIEHLLSDLHQDDLDQAHAARGQRISPRLLTYLNTLDQGFGTDPAGDYGFRALVLRALQGGMRVIAIDCAASYYDASMRTLAHEHGGRDGALDTKQTVRLKMMNFFALQVIQQWRHAEGGKWVALCGTSHLKTNFTVPDGQPATPPGLADLTGGLALRTVDTPAAAGGPTIVPDPGEIDEGSLHWGRGTYRYAGDFLLTMPLPESRSAPAVAATPAAPAAPAAPADSALAGAQDMRVAAARHRGRCVIS